VWLLMSCCSSSCAMKLLSLEKEFEAKQWLEQKLRN